jgi:hypothetical protein
VRKASRVVARFVAGWALVALLAAPAWPQDVPPAPAAAPPGAKSTIDRIEDCVFQSREFLLSDSECMTERYGADRRIRDQSHIYSEQLPYSQDEDQVCSDPPNPQHAKQVLPGNIVKQFVRDKRKVGAAGIRISGAIFCEELDLAGLDLPYSLVIDRSVFKKGIDARNLKAAGDLSFDNGIIFDHLNLRRARIDGSFWGRYSFFENVDVSDVEMKGTASFDESVILKQASFVGASISRDLNLGRTAISKLILRSSQVTGELNLSESETRCGYELRAATIGRLTAHRAGFGRIVRSSNADGTSVDRLWWSRTFPSPPIRNGPPQAIFASKAIAKTLKMFRADLESRPPRLAWKTGCEDKPVGDKPSIEQLTFVVLDSVIQGRFCLSEFAWADPGDAGTDALPETVIALNATRIPGNAAINLAGISSDGKTNTAIAPVDAQSRDKVKKKRRFEALGLTSGELLFNFEDVAQMPYETWLDGLVFERVAKARLACKLAVQDVKDTLPSSKEVIDWLVKNTAPSSQPFKAFTDAFEHAGADASDLRVERKTIDLCRKTPSWLPFVPCRQPAPEGTGPLKADTGAAVTRLDAASEFVWVLAQWGLYHLADHGVRPGKVVWWLLGVLAFFLIVFRRLLKIVGFKPKEKDKTKGHAKTSRPWNLGPLFLFDRLLPLYKIREEHYAIDTYFRKATRAEIAEKRSAADPPYQMSYFWTKSWVYPVSEHEKERAEKWLVALRIIGAVLAIFLLAAVNALTARG